MHSVENQQEDYTTNNDFHKKLQAGFAVAPEQAVTLEG